MPLGIQRVARHILLMVLFASAVLSQIHIDSTRSESIGLDIIDYLRPSEEHGIQREVDGYARHY